MSHRQFAAFSATSASSLVLALSGLALGSSAAAQVLETSTISNSYSYRVGSQQGSNANAPGNVNLFISDLTNGFQSDLGLELTASLNQGSFSFLHNGYCVGDCSVTITTNITFTLTNMGTTPVDLRFDSLITPGHLARSNFFGATPAQFGNFLFDVTQDSTQLYRAAGVNVINPPLIETSDNRPFNALTPDDNPPAWNVLDWSATNLNLNLATIGAGQTSTLTYNSVLFINTFNPTCPDTTQCLGYQVAFGDPRDRGAPTINSGIAAPLQSFNSAFAAFAPSELPSAGGSDSPAVGALFDPFLVTYAFVPVGSPLPPPPLPEPPQSYDIPYSPIDAVPEPATWAMMLLGFAAIGASVRRRRTGWQCNASNA